MTTTELRRLLSLLEKFGTEYDVETEEFLIQIEEAIDNKDNEDDEANLDFT